MSRMHNSGNPPDILRPVARLSRNRSEPNSALSSGSNAKHKRGWRKARQPFWSLFEGLLFVAEDQAASAIQAVRKTFPSFPKTSITLNGECPPNHGRRF